MNKRNLTQLLKTGLTYSVHKAMPLLIFLTWHLAAGATSIDTVDKVSHDIEMYKQFQIQSKALSQTMQGVFVTIGADPACDFDSAVDSIQAAIAEGSVEVRVASNGTYHNNLVLENQTVVIRGGFADCVAANDNQQDVNKFAIIDGSGASEPVIYITGSEVNAQVRLENLVLQGGTSLLPKFGGGLSVDMASVNLQLWRVVIRENTGSAGAGLHIDAGLGADSVTTSVMGLDVLIENNESSGFGGGLNCIGSAEIAFTGMSLINNNLANIGGGVSLRNGCKLSIYPEYFEDSLGFIAGIFFNQSLSNGGGAYIFNGSEIYLFGQKMCDESGCMGSDQTPVYVYGNESGLSSDFEGNGGGFYMAQSKNQNVLYANGLIMLGNSAQQNGGGGYLDSNSIVTIERQTGGCWDQVRCNHITYNRSGTNFGFGGAFYVADGSELTIGQSYFEENRADFGTAINAIGLSAKVEIEGAVFNGNGDYGNSEFSDFNLIRASLGASILISHSSIVDNKLQSDVFDVGENLDSSLAIFNSIVHDPNSINLFAPNNGTVVVSCLLAHEADSYNGFDVIVADPLFNDRMGGDFHLTSTSPAIDLCFGIPLLYPLDIDGEVRGWDDPFNVHGFGFNDAGADEYYINDMIFKNDFETILARNLYE